MFCCVFMKEDGGMGLFGLLIIKKERSIVKMESKDIF